MNNAFNIVSLSRIHNDSSLNFLKYTNSMTPKVVKMKQITTWSQFANTIASVLNLITSCVLSSPLTVTFIKSSGKAIIFTAIISHKTGPNVIISTGTQISSFVVCADASAWSSAYVIMYNEAVVRFGSAKTKFVQAAGSL